MDINGRRTQANSFTAGSVLDVPSHTNAQLPAICVKRATTIVSEECDDDDNRQYLQFRPYDDGFTPGLGQFQFVETNLCLTMEKLGGRDFTLEACADTVKGEYNARQYFAGFNETNRFDFIPTATILSA